MTALVDCAPSQRQAQFETSSCAQIMKQVINAMRYMTMLCYTQLLSVTQIGNRVYMG